MFKDNSALLALKENLESQKEKVTGKVKFTRQSFGFLESETKVVFIPPDIMKTLLPDDVIIALIEKEDDREFVGKVLNVLESPSMKMTGKIVEKEWKGSKSKKFLPNNPNYSSIIPLLGNQNDLIANEWINVELTAHPSKERLFKATQTSSIGNEGNPRLPWDYIRHEFDINSYINDLKITSRLASIDKYEDRTEMPYVTIDAESSKDMDDALFVFEDDDYFYLSVAISDPSDLIFDDKKQRKVITSRGFTFYLPGDVVHMIQRELSEEHFSLKENEVRQVVCLDIKISKKDASVVKYDFVLALIKSAKKLSYNYVTEIIENGTVLEEAYYDSLITLHSLSKALKSKRSETEAIFVEREEYSLIVDNFEPVGVKVSKSTLANVIVEEAMILSNKLFAEFAIKNGLNVLFNTNEGFKVEAKEDIELIVNEAGIELINGSIFDMANVIHIQKQINDKIISAENDAIKLKYEDLLTRLRRCFNKSVIQTEALPHKIMGVNAYATWTSPLRKAIDMINHIAIKRFLLGMEQESILEEEVESINERNETSRQAERLLSKILFAKLFDKKPELINKAKVKVIKKQMVLLELEGSGQYCTLQLRNIRTKVRPADGKRPNIYADLDEGKVLLGKNTLFSVGEFISVDHHFSSLITQDIEVKLIV